MSNDDEYIDLSNLQSETAREAFERANLRIAANKIHLHRLAHVLNEFWVFTPDSHHTIGELAIICAMGFVAKSERCESCRTLFQSYVDLLYCETSDAESLTELQREDIEVAAKALYEHNLPRLNETLQESCHAFGSLEQNDLRRQNASATLQTVLHPYLEHADQFLLRDFIVKCVHVCDAIELDELGCEDPNLDAAILDLARAGLALCRRVDEEIDNGSLIVQNGEIVRIADTDDE